MMKYFGTIMGTMLIFAGMFFIYVDYALRPLQLRIEEMRNHTEQLIKERIEKYGK